MWWSGIGAAVYVVAIVALIVRAISRPNRAPEARTAWVAVIVAVPLVGLLAYLALGETDIGLARVRSLRRADAELDAVPSTAAVAVLDEPALALSDLCRSINGFAPVGGNRIELIGDPQAPAAEPMRDSVAAVEAMVEAIGRAREHVHLSFYIWLDDQHGGQVVDAVAAAARRGVSCRVMVDALGSRDFTRSRRWRQLQDAGVQVAATLNDIPRLGHLAVGRIDLRNHRKLAIVDGTIAFCGSQNCADPQFLPKARFAPWVDLWLRCEGPIVEQAQRLFAATWTAETGESLAELVASSPAPVTGGVVAQMYGTGPTTAGNGMSDSFVGAMYAAREELIITTPYFVPDEALLRALTAAPRRGVATTLVVPARNDSPLVAGASRSAYPALLDSGVLLFEYPLGLLHSKSITVDGEISLVGSANLDRRSLELNFENNLLVVDRGVTAALRSRQLGYLSQSHAVTRAEVDAWPLWRRTLQNAVGMASPVL